MKKIEVKKAIKFGYPSEVPIKTEDVLGTAFDKYGDALREIFKRYPDDFLFLNHRGPKDWRPSRPGEDEFGCVWKEGLVAEHPIYDWECLDSYKMPGPHAEGRFDIVKGILYVPIDIYCIGSISHGLFLRLSYMREFENLMGDFYQEKDRLHELIDRLTNFYLGIVEEWGKIGVDCLFFGDDIATKSSLMISPASFREFLKIPYTKIFDMAHKCGMEVFFHTCGNFTDLIDDLIECGADILNSVQADCMDIEKIGKRYRGKVCFCGGVGTLTSLRYGTPKDVEKEVIRAIETLGTEKGGYILCPDSSISPDMPLENIEALFKTAKEYRYNG